MPGDRRRRRVRRVRRHARDGLHADDGAEPSTTSRRSASTWSSSLTNTTPMGAYRGAGRPEAASLVERIIDMAADELGMDPVELRRKNLIQPDEFPYTTVTGATYDSGDYDAPLHEAMRIADYDALLAEQAARRERGDAKQLGIGVCALRGGHRRRRRRVLRGRDPRRRQRHAQGGHVRARPGARHRVLGRSCPTELGIPIEKIRFVQSDTALVRAWRRHRRLAVAAARRQLGVRDRRSSWPTGPRSSRPSCSRRRPTTS